MGGRTKLRLCVALAAIGALLAALVILTYASSVNAVWPEPSGASVASDRKLVVDASHSDQGYVMVRVSKPGKNRFKVRVTKDKGQLTYDLNPDGEFEVFPLQLGSGSYEFALYENVKGTKYASEGKVALWVELADENAAFLVTNQYVDYDMESTTVAAADELTASLTSQAEIYEAVCNYMADNFSYDYVRAQTIGAGELPEVDACFDRKSGICQDMSAVMVCMLRSQGIPAKLMIGYADKYYHAWTVAVVDGEEKFFDPTAAIGALNAKKYQVERYY